MSSCAARHRLLLLALTPLLATACALPDLGGLLGGDTAECRFDRDCGDDEECSRGSCVPLDEVAEGEGEGEGEGDLPPDPPPDPEGPQYLQFSTNVTAVDPSDTVIFTAVLTDPDGIDDIIGGSLVDPGSNASYGAFTTSAAEGSYELVLLWEAINTVAPIDFATTGSRAFRARFFDVAGHTAERTVTLSLTCNGPPACDGSCGGARCGDGSCTFQQDAADSNGNGICGGLCTDLVSNSHCGSCATSCSGSGQCVDAFGDNDYQCSCGAGDCGSGDACVDSICQGASLGFDGSAGLPGSVNLSGNTVCGFSSGEANLACQDFGFASGALGPNTNLGFGFAVDCSGASALADCVFTQENNCTNGSIVCSDGPPPPPPPPEGDYSCAAATLSGSSSGVTSGSSARQGSCGTSSGPERIFEFTAASAGDYVFATAGSSFDTVVYVQTDCAATTDLACNDDVANDSTSSAQVSLAAEQTVIVVVDGFNGAAGNFQVSVTRL